MSKQINLWDLPSGDIIIMAPTLNAGLQYDMDAFQRMLSVLNILAAVETGALSVEDATQLNTVSMPVPEVQFEVTDVVEVQPGVKYTANLNAGGNSYPMTISVGIILNSFYY